MNREIKFRAWNYKEMIYNVSIRNSLIQNHIDKFDYIKSSNYPIMQFTGLHDKNGKEIYEGDVYKTEKGNSCYQIMFVNGCVVGGKTEKEYMPLSWDVSESNNTIVEDDFYKEIEVVGNIYETPELLKN